VATGTVGFPPRLGLTTWRVSPAPARRTVAAAGRLGSVQGIPVRPAMANCRLNVTYAEQKDTTKCWLASAWMVINFSSPKPMAEVETQLLPLSTSTEGVVPATSTFDLFLQKTRFQELWPSSKSQERRWPPEASWTPEGLDSALRLNGPLWCAGDFYGFPHAITVFGVLHRMVYFHDPLLGPNKMCDIDLFNRGIKCSPRNPVLCYPL
jgi:hypothetical protein